MSATHGTDPCHEDFVPSAERDCRKKRLHLNSLQRARLKIETLPLRLTPVMVCRPATTIHGTETRHEVLGP